MTNFIGRLVKVGVAKEAVRGAGAAPTYLLPHTSLSFDDKVVSAREEAGIGRIEDSDNVFVTTKYGQGEIEGEVRDKSFGLLLYAMLGTTSPSGPTDSCYTHSFTVSNTNNHQSLALTVQDSNTTEMYKLSMLNSLEIKAELDNIVKYTAEFMSKKGTSSSATIPAVLAENKFTKKHLSLKIAENIAALGEATPLSVKNLTLTISKNLILDDVLGTAEPEDIFNQQLVVEGEFELNYGDETFKNYMKDATTKSMEIKFTNTDVYAAGTTNPSLTIQMPKVDFMEWEANYGLDEIVKQKVSFKGNYDVANGLAVISTCQLVNAVVSY